MLHYETILPGTLDLLKRIQSLEEFSGTRLVGGTALALLLGHRESIDLDFFGQMNSSIEELTAAISSFADVSPISSTRMMRFLVINGVKVDVVNYPYNWIGTPVVENGITIAGIEDIAAMKLSAITNRGTKKDFIDLFYLLDHYSLAELLNLYHTKYRDSQLFTVMKSLTYFEDAESDPMPRMNQDIEWNDVKLKISKEVTEYLRRR